MFRELVIAIVRELTEFEIEQWIPYWLEMSRDLKICYFGSFLVLPFSVE